MRFLLARGAGALPVTRDEVARATPGSRIAAELGTGKEEDKAGER
jgi:hypothetical protein